MGEAGEERVALICANRRKRESRGRDILGRKTIFCGFHHDLEVAQPKGARLKQAVELQQEALCPCPPPPHLP